MQLATGSAPSRWVVTLHSGGTVEVWADSVEGLAGDEDRHDYTFSNLMDVAPELQAGFDITARTPTNPHRVIVTVARFPRQLVADVQTGRSSSD